MVRKVGFANASANCSKIVGGGCELIGAAGDRKFSRESKLIWQGDGFNSSLRPAHAAKILPHAEATGQDTDRLVGVDSRKKGDEVIKVKRKENSGNGREKKVFQAFSAVLLVARVG